MALSWRRNVENILKKLRNTDSTYYSMVWVGKNYSKADLIRDLEDALRELSEKQILENLEARGETSYEDKTNMEKEM